MASTSPRLTPCKTFGFVANGFQPVRAQFESNFAEGLEENAQLCVYFNGEKVVDLWGVMDDSHNYNAESMTCIFSSTKVLTSICMATLVDKGLLAYTDKVTEHWPEYSAGDREKENTTIADVLRHECGIPMFSKTMSLADIQTDNIKKNSIGSMIEQEQITYPEEKSNTKREYHAVTRGMILNEIFRRVDPRHRTLGECLREDISAPLGIQTQIGLLYEELRNSFNMTMLPLPAVALQSTLPRTVRKVAPNFADLVKMGLHLFPYRNAAPVLEPLTHTYDIEDVMSRFTYSVVKTGQLPSANGQSSARGLAKLAAMMTNGGQIDGVRILSEETCELLHEKGREATMHPFGDSTIFTQAGVNVFETVAVPGPLSKHNNTCRKGFVGWQGMGGSVCQWHRDYNIGFGYVPTFLAYEDPSNTRGALLQLKVVECVERMRREEGWEEVEVEASSEK